MRIKLRKFDTFFKILIWFSLVLYIVEISYGNNENSLEGLPFFLWAERIVAGLMTWEYLVRLRRNRGGWYALSPLGIIDLIAILPFWLGFFVPVNYLGLVRTLRVLRLLKYFRYSRPLQFIALGFYRVTSQLRSLGFAMLIVLIFSTTVMFEAERKAQPDKFNNLFNTAWFTVITVATVGYGDMAPTTNLGKLVALVTLFPSLAIFGAMVGILATAFSKVLEEEANPDLDPLMLFMEVREQKARVRKIDRDYR